MYMEEVLLMMRQIKLSLLALVPVLAVAAFAAPPASADPGDCSQEKAAGIVSGEIDAGDNLLAEFESCSPGELS